MCHGEQGSTADVSRRRSRRTRTQALDGGMQADRPDKKRGEDVEATTRDWFFLRL